MNPTDEQIEAAAKAMAFETRSKLDVSKDAEDFWQNTGHEGRIMYLSCARAALTAAGVKPRVKPLVWKDNGGGYLDARTAVGCYEIQKRGGGPYGFSLNGQYKREAFPAIEAAKAAAQADYEARILSALTTEGE